MSIYKICWGYKIWWVEHHFYINPLLTSFLSPTKHDLFLTFCIGSNGICHWINWTSCSIVTLKVFLVEWISRKIKIKKRNFVVGYRCFLPGPTEKFFPQNGEKTESASFCAPGLMKMHMGNRRKLGVGFCAHGLMKMPMCTCTWATSMPSCVVVFSLIF